MKSSFALAAALFFTAIPLANAHIVAVPDSGIAGTYFQTSLRVAHGCEKSATVELHVKMPTAIISAHPQAKPGWTAEIVTRKLDQPQSIGHGKTTDEAVSEIIWRDGSLPADNYDDFGLLLQLPANTAGQTLWFPVTQVCTDGQNDWAAIPAQGQAWHDLPHPAPFVHVTAAPADTMPMHRAH